MEVEIKQTILISPTSPPFDHDHILSLSHLDNDRNVQVNFRYVRAYGNNTTATTSSSDPVHVISEALGKALVHFYPFAGTLRRRSNDHRLELFCATGQTAPLISAGVNRTLNSVNHLDNPADPFLEQLVPNPNPDDSLLHPFVLQVTVFQCGGFTLGASIHHSMCDGLGSTQFFNVMAEFARGGTQPSVQAVWNRSSLLGPRDPPRVEVPFHEFLCLDKEFSPYSRPSEDVVRACFDVKDELVERFKAALKEESGMSFTTFEALGAFIWRARVLMAMIKEQMDQMLAIMRDMVTRRENPLARMNKDFKALNGKAFAGGGDVHKAQEWLLLCGRVFREMDITEVQKRKVAECQLTEDALCWWETQRTCLTEEVLRDLTWTQFKEIFSQQFVPRVNKRKYRKELLQVEQGELSVFEFMKKINTLLMYAPPTLLVEEEKIEIFVNGLRPEIKLYVRDKASKGVFVDVYNKALLLEELLMEESIARDELGAPREKSLFHPYQNSEPIIEEVEDKPEPLQMVTTHRVEVDVLPEPEIIRRCYHCNGEGHIARDCPQRIQRRGGRRHRG